MKPIVVQLDIRRPAPEVFAFLEQVENNPQWLRGMVSCHWTSETPIGIGSRYDQRARFLGKEIVTTFEVTAHEPGSLITISSQQGASFPLTVTRRVDPRGAGECRVTEIVESDPRGFYRVAVPLLRLAVSSNIRRDYRRLKRLLEGSTG